MAFSTHGQWFKVSLFWWLELLSGGFCWYGNFTAMYVHYQLTPISACDQRTNREWSKSINTPFLKPWRRVRVKFELKVMMKPKNRVNCLVGMSYQRENIADEIAWIRKKWKEMLDWPSKNLEYKIMISRFIMCFHLLLCWQMNRIRWFHFLIFVKKKNKQ